MNFGMPDLAEGRLVAPPPPRFLAKGPPRRALDSLRAPVALPRAAEPSHKGCLGLITPRLGLQATGAPDVIHLPGNRFTVDRQLGLEGSVFKALQNLQAIVRWTRDRRHGHGVQETKLNQTSLKRVSLSTDEPKLNQH